MYNIETAHDIYKIREKIEDTYSWYKLSKEKKPLDHVWNEDWSVRQNREYTENHNASIDTKVAEMKEAYHNARKELETSICKFIQESCAFAITKAQSEAIWNWCVYRFEDDAHNYIDTVLDLIEKYEEGKLN